MKIKNIFLGMTMGLALLFSSCSGFLDQEPDSILTDDQVFGDAKLIKSLMASFYGKITWGQWTANYGEFYRLDEASYCDGTDVTNSFEDDLWRVYDYTYIRQLNQALNGIRTTSALSESDRTALEGEVRYIRAWIYFNMARCLGGMPIVGDTVFEYNGPEDVEAMQIARSTESEMYDYIISECAAAANMLSSATNTNSARANKWVALMLEARAAIYAASLANYNNKIANPIKTAGGEVGIDASKANGYYQTALAAAKNVIENGPYALQMDDSNLGVNFYNAVCIKDPNTEVIWSRDYIYPGTTHGWSSHNVAPICAEDIDMAMYCPNANIVDAFEFANDRDGKIKTTDANGDYIYYDSPEAAFAGKDARLWASVIYPNAEYNGKVVAQQAGQKVYNNGTYTTVTAEPDTYDSEGRLITAYSGPVSDARGFMGKTGFYFRKFMDTTVGAATRGRGSEMWYPYFRISEAYLIASEASMELGNNSDACKYINAVRKRAGIQDLTTVTLDDIIKENRVEFAFEGHRYYDLKRWRVADKIWNGVMNDENAQQWALFCYLVVGGPHDGKYVYERIPVPSVTYPRYFQLKNYYNFIDDSWVSNNPKMVKNPYQD